MQTSLSKTAPELTLAGRFLKHSWAPSSDVAFWVLWTASGVLALSHACSAHMTVVALFLGGDLHLDHSHRTHRGGGWDGTGLTVTS